MNNSNVDYYSKYLKYKNKYLKLRNQIGNGKNGESKKDPDYKNLIVQENLLLNKKILSENSSEGIIYKVNYNGKNYVYKKSILSNHSGFSIRNFNILGDDYLLELILELKIINKISEENNNILKIYKIVLDENNKFTGWLMEDLSNMITLSKFCSQDNLNLNDQKNI